ncbi:MAG TPA: T9SS type A sorting domain-containing protein [Gemmatimonas sp.]|nr:T9SS type A sorting domain-containing protein [Gemmatimonas sp.]
MKRPWAALGLVLALSVMAGNAEAQDMGSRQSRSGMSLGQNYPNPFNPETTIPFGVGDPPTCAEQGKQHRVTLRVYNPLYQLVSVPVVQGGANAGQPINNLLLPCGDYLAYWDGKNLRTGREAASGIYYIRLEVDGKTLVSKAIATK